MGVGCILRVQMVIGERREGVRRRLGRWAGRVLLVGLVLAVWPRVAGAQVADSVGVVLPEVAVRPRAAQWVGFVGKRIPAAALRTNPPAGSARRGLVLPAALVGGRRISALQLYLHPGSRLGGAYEVRAYAGDCLPADCHDPVWTQDLVAEATGWVTVSADIRVPGALTLLVSSDAGVDVAIARSADASRGYVYTDRTGWIALQELTYESGRPVLYKPALRVRVE